MENTPRPSGPSSNQTPEKAEGETAGEGEIERGCTFPMGKNASAQSQMPLQQIAGDPITVGANISSMRLPSIVQLAKALQSRGKKLDRQLPPAIQGANRKKKAGKRANAIPKSSDDGFIEDLEFSSRPGLIDPKDFADYLIRPKLITAMVSHVDTGVILHAFHASITCNLYEIREHLVTRYGEEALESADFRYGYHAGHPLVIALVPDPIAEVILRIQSEETVPAREGFVIDIEHRIQA